MLARLHCPGTPSFLLSRTFVQLTGLRTAEHAQVGEQGEQTVFSETVAAQGACSAAHSSGSGSKAVAHPAASPRARLTLPTPGTTLKCESMYSSISLVMTWQEGFGRV